MLTAKPPIRYFYMYRLIFIIVLLDLVIPACGFQSALPTNISVPPSQSSPSPIQTSIFTQNLTLLPPSFENGTLAYLDYNPTANGKSRIITIDIATGESQVIEFECFLCNNFSFSPDATHIALEGVKEFSSHLSNEIMLLDVKGDEIRQFQYSPDCIVGVSWSPDSKYLLFTNDYECKRLDNDVVVLELATNATIKLTNTKGWKSEPTWSPNGKYIAYGYRNLVSDDNEGTDGYLWLMDSNGKNPHQISDMPIGSHFQISWSPDSSMVAFSSPMTCGDIYITNIRTNDTKLFFDTNGCATNPVWSPDGKVIAVLVTDYFPVSNQVDNWQILLLSVDRKNIVPVVHRQGRQPPLYLGWVPADENTNSQFPK